MLFQLLIFFASKISCSVFETGISFRFVVPTFESFSASFSPVFRPLIYEQVRGELGVKLRHVVHEDWLVSCLSLHVPNMVLAKMNNYEHRSKPIYASYTFQVLMSFWLNLYECFYTFYTNRRRIFSLSLRKQPMKKKEAQFLGNQSARLRPRGYVFVYYLHACWIWCDNQLCT